MRLPERGTRRSDRLAMNSQAINLPARPAERRPSRAGTPQRQAETAGDAFQRPDAPTPEEIEERLADIERQFRVAALQLHATTAENEILKQNIGILRQRAETAETAMSDVPWRVVKVYRRLRRCVPSPLLHMAARVLDGLVRLRSR